MSISNQNHSRNISDNIIKQSIKTNLRKFREANGFTQTQIGIILGTGRTTYTKWESGDTLPNPVQLAMLASIYNKSVNDFYRDENEIKLIAEITLRGEIGKQQVIYEKNLTNGGNSGIVVSNDANA